MPVCGHINDRGNDLIYSPLKTGQQCVDEFGFYVMTKEEIVNQQQLDSVLCVQLWATGFTSVIGLYLIAHSAGVILDFLRRN